MANTVYMSKTGLTGGEATKLDSIDGATLTDNDAAFVNVSNVQYIYRLDADSGAAESSPNIIAPATNPGDKRWILQTMTEASLILSGLTASLPVFTDGSKKLVSKSVADTLTALGVGAWTDYSASSTIVGWSSKSSSIRYKIIDKLCFVFFSIGGTSNSTSVSFTLPTAYRTGTGFDLYAGGVVIVNNGSYSLNPGKVSMTAGYANVNVYADHNGAGWTASGTKSVYGEFFYEIA